MFLLSALQREQDFYGKIMIFLTKSNAASISFCNIGDASCTEAMECFVPTPGENLPDGIEAPRLTLSPPSFKLVWFSRNQATPPTYVRFELKRVNGLTLHAEIVDIPWPMRVVP